MLARLRRALLSLPARIVAGLYLLYLLLGWFAFDPLVRWGLPKLVGERSGYRLTIERARFNPFGLTVELQGVALQEPQGKPLLALQRVFADFELASLPRRAYVFDQFQLERPAVQLELLADGNLNWLNFLAALAGPSTEPPPAAEQDLTRLVVRHFALAQGRVDFTDRQVAGGFETRLDPLDFELHELSTLPEDKGQHKLAARLGPDAELRWKGELELNPLRANGEFVLNNLGLERLWPYLRDHLNMAPPQGKASLSFGYRASYANERLALQLDRLEAGLQGLALRGKDDAEPALRLDALTIAGGQLDLEQRRLSLQSIALRGGRIAAARGVDGRIDLQDWLRPSAPAAAAPPAQPAASRPWALAVQQASVDGLALRYLDRGFKQPLTAEVGAFKLGLKVEGLVGGSEAPDLRLQDLRAEASALKLRSGSTAQPWLELGSALLEEGQLKLAAREASLGRVLLSGGTLNALRDASGQLSLLAALQAQGAVAVPEPDSAKNAKEQAWRYRLGKFELSQWRVGLRDESSQPAATLNLQNIQASAEGLSEDAKAAVPLRLSLDVQEGGRLELSGKAVPAAPSADLRLKLQGLALAPAGPQLAAVSDLKLARGQADLDGRLLYAKGEPSFEGSFALRDLLITQNQERFLAWKRLSSRRLSVDLHGLKAGVVELDGLGAKLIIAKDRTLNVVKAFHPRVGASAPAAKAQAGAPPYRVDVARVRFESGEMDFADLSLALPFGTHIHQLKGYIVGLSTQPGNQARVELGGQVDEYGLASAAGTLNPADPTDAMDLKVQFKNVEMTSLTPYSATFAGRRIDSGKLSLNLDYKLQSRQLKGENQIIMDKLKLGERVPGSDAPSLPLDLAVSLLEDSDGRIDLGLPVSGSLDDPQFSIGGIVWKAFTGLLTKIVTAPFRAIGALLGGGGDADKLADIQFAAGDEGLQPPEREKLDQLAKALGQRPGLALEVAGAYDPAADKAALQDLSLRRAYAKQRGRDVSAERDPGPVGTRQPEAQKALEALFVQRFGAAALEQLRVRYRQANPDVNKPGVAAAALDKVKNLFKAAPPPLSEEEAARLRGADLHDLIKQRLQDSEPVGESQLQSLAQQRAQGIRQQMLTRGVAAERVRMLTPELRAAEGAAVHVKLKLGAAAAMPPAAAGKP
ncbi:MAG TPA: DUF748 domain-containing protein [Roseateles sp.]|nr:DUF748 domain-containing protein [Roseateles sp.]